jgi:hypothetical protein
MSRHFLPEAADELAAAVAYYDEKSVGLGDRFLDSVEKALNFIEQWPEANPLSSAETRRCLLPPFLFALIYALEDAAVLVIAVANLHREPGYWRKRLAGK